MKKIFFFSFFLSFLMASNINVIKLDNGAIIRVSVQNVEKCLQCNKPYDSVKIDNVKNKKKVLKIAPINCKQKFQNKKILYKKINLKAKTLVDTYLYKYPNTCIKTRLLKKGTPIIIKGYTQYGWALTKSGKWIEGYKIYPKIKNKKTIVKNQCPFCK